MKRSYLALLVVALVAPTCSDDAQTPAGDSGAGKDASTPDQSHPGDGASTPDGAGAYPAGPHRSAPGDVIKDLSFRGFMDKDFRCKANKDHVAATSVARTVTLGDDYREPASCAVKRRLQGGHLARECLGSGQEDRPGQSTAIIDRGGR